MTTYFEAGFSQSGEPRRIAEGVYSLSQKKGGRVHAYLLDDGEGLTPIDTLFDNDAGRVLAAIKEIGRERTSPAARKTPVAVAMLPPSSRLLAVEAVIGEPVSVR
jgi:hypothetical protein